MGKTKSKRDVAQASSPASSGTVPVPVAKVMKQPLENSSGETFALHDANPLVAGFHSRGVLPHLKKEGGTYL
jgi:hypothetical protein